jgi:ATP-dependent DNA ligase
MRAIFDFCFPTKSTSVHDGPDWLHEIKYDRYRPRVERDGDRVRLFTGRLQLDQPRSVDRGSRAEERTKQFDMHGEAVILRADGIADFNALHSRKHDDEVQLDAFDILALDGTTCATYRECRSNDVSIIVRSILEQTIRSENDQIELLSTDTAAMSALPSRTDVVNVAGDVR